VGGVQLQIEGGDFGGFLFFAGELGQAIGEGVGDAKFR
jgi:hypothetical protein